MTEALDCLKKCITPRTDDKQRLNHLARLVVCKDKSLLFASQGGVAEARKQVLKEILKLVSPQKIVDSGRLETLMQQAIQYQISKCSYHNTAANDFSLLQDHKCKDNKMPSVCIKTLGLNGDEIWEVEFSANGKYLATVSRNNIVVIWEFTKIPAENLLRIRAVEFAASIDLEDQSARQANKLLCLVAVGEFLCHSVQR